MEIQILGTFCELKIENLKDFLLADSWCVALQLIKPSKKNNSLVSFSTNCAQRRTQCLLVSPKFLADLVKQRARQLYCISTRKSHREKKNDTRDYQVLGQDR
jgi:hypothetical protein